MDVSISPIGQNDPVQDRTVQTDVKIVYLVLAIIWLLLIIFFKLYQIDTNNLTIKIIAWIILLLPFLIFALGAYYSEAEDQANAEIDADNSLSIGILLLLPLIVFADKNYVHNPKSRNRFIALSLIAISFYLLSYIVIFTPQRYQNLVNRISSGLVTLSVILMVYLLILFYIHRSSREYDLPDEVVNFYQKISLDCS